MFFVHVLTDRSFNFACHIFLELTPAKRVHVDSDSGEEHELDAKEPVLKSDREALKLTDMLLEYSDSLSWKGRPFTVHQ